MLHSDVSSEALSREVSRMNPRSGEPQQNGTGLDSATYAAPAVTGKVLVTAGTADCSEERANQFATKLAWVLAISWVLLNSLIASTAIVFLALWTRLAG